MTEWNENTVLRCKKGSIGHSKGEPWFSDGKYYPVKVSSIRQRLVVEDNQGYSWEVKTVQYMIKQNDVCFEVLHSSEVKPELDLNKLTTTQLQKYLTAVHLVEHNEKVVQHAQDELREAKIELAQSKEDLEKFKTQLANEVVE